MFWGHTLLDVCMRLRLFFLQGIRFIQWRDTKKIMLYLEV
jgi:hypothetical protein